MKINYESITKNIISSAVKTHLRTELKVHCSKVAKLKATAWPHKNRKAIEASIEKSIEDKLKVELPNVIKNTAKNVTVRAPIKSRRYY